MVLFVLGSAIGCHKPAEQSPPTLDDLTLAAITSFHSDAAAANVAALRTWVAGQEDSWPDGYTLGAITADDVGDVPHTDDVDWDRVLGAGVPLRVEGTLDGYAAAATEADQTFADPTTYIKWDRTITGGTPEDFEAGGPMETDNDLEKSGPFGIVIPYQMPKDFIWFDDTIGALTWVPEPGFGDDGKNGIVCGFTIELWWEDDDGVVWYNGSWSELKTVVDDLADPSFFVSELISGTQDYMHGTETHVLGEDAE